MTATPHILLVAFNRPQHVARVLDRIRETRPSVLHVASDGPRVGRTDDLKDVQAVRELVLGIDWCADVRTRFRTVNLGCGRAVADAITWFLEDVGEGVIIEDDCLPDPTFFRFCGELLDRYREASNVMQISGYNFLGRAPGDGESDYFLSHFGWQWGWATWRRAWRLFDSDMANWPLFKRLGYHRRFPFYSVRARAFDHAAGRSDIWDFQWHYAMASNSGLSVVPRQSLVENIGFGAGATHGTDDALAWRYRVPVQPMTFPMNHCPFIYADQRYDRRLMRAVHGLRLGWRLKKGAARIMRSVRLGRWV